MRPAPASLPVVVAGRKRFATRDDLRPDAPQGFEQSSRWVTLADDGGTPCPGDAGFLPTDAVAVAAQPVLMIQIDRRDSGDIGVDDVHGIQSPAQANLDDGNVE